ncbi:NUDIX domain-containing protein [Actinoplanes sp. CA-054009]
MDIVILTIRGEELCVLLIKRGKEPHHGKSALPGGFVRPGESLEEAASRQLQEETNLRGGGRSSQNFQRRIREIKGFVVPTHELRVGRPGRRDVTRHRCRPHRLSEA